MESRRRQYMRRAIARRVLLVASMNYHDGDLFDWAVYVDAVDGNNHDEEFEAVAANGSKVPSAVAAIYFPGVDITKYRD